MKTYDSVQSEIINQHIGDYIKLGGMGIMDGLKYSKDRNHLYKIISVDDEGMHVKRYRARRGNVLPTYNFNQACQIISQEEYKNVPIPRY